MWIGRNAMKDFIQPNATHKAEEILQYAAFEQKILNISALFSDETQNYRNPCEPKSEDYVQVFFRTAKENVEAVYVAMDGMKWPMTLTRTEGLFDYYSYTFAPTDETQYYYFELVCNNRSYFYTKLGFSYEKKEDDYFQIIRNFHTPDWAKGSVMYQIYVDRFYNGDTSNDVLTGEYEYLSSPVKKMENWEHLPDDEDIRNFYGGDLQGVLEKLDYLEELGVEVIYFNPLFVSPSNHKYDIQDYDFIDPHIGVITTEGTGDSVYIERTTNEKNLEASNALFAKLVENAHKRGMRVLVDGVFNHCGAFHKWMDREGIYAAKEGRPVGAFGHKDSRYYDYFSWKEDGTYECWWGFPNHPKLNFENSEELTEYILQIGKKWVSEPFFADGWRLDVAADVGHSAEFNHEFWKKFKTAVKSTRPDSIIIAEHYGDPSSWLQGEEWDSIMNYDAFMEPVSWFFTGMEKHSDYFQGEVWKNAQYFCESMIKQMAKLPIQSLQTAMNQLSNHDHSRFLTRTNQLSGRLHTKGHEAAAQGIVKSVMKMAVLLQMTWPGAPAVYYGDEAGMVGWTDPDNRRTYPWGKEDGELLEFHKVMIALRKKYTALKTGSLLFLYAENGVLSYGRFDRTNRFIIVINRDTEIRKCEIPVWMAEVSKNALLKTLMLTSEQGFSTEQTAYALEEGMFSIEMMPCSAVVLMEDRGEDDEGYNTI